MSNDQTVRGFYPGYRARNVAKIGLVSSLIFFMVLASIGAWLPGLVSAIGSIFPVPQGSQESCSPLLANTTTAVDPLHQICATANGTSGEVVPQGVDASRLPDLHMPKEVVSGVANAGLTGVVRTASDNLTLYGHDLMLRMIGGLNPHDELVGGTGRGVKPALTWVVDAWNGQSWVSIPVASTSFTVLDPNSNAGTSVVRSIGFGKPTLIALLNVTYIVSQTGGLSWSLDLKPLVSSEYRIDLSISETTQVPSTPANTITLPANDTSIAPRENSTSPSPTSAKLWIGPAEYALSWSDVPPSFKTTTSQNGRHFNLSIDLGSVVAGGSIVVDPSLVGSDNDNLGATTYPFQHHIYQDPKTGYYWIFYHDPGIPNGNGIVYRYSPDGSNWYPSPYYTIPSAWWCGWCYGPDDSVASPAIYFIGETVIMAGGASYASGGLLDGSPQYLYMTLMTGTLSGTQIIWHPGGTGSGPFFESGQCWNAYDQNNPFNCYMSVGIRYLSVATDSAGRIWLTLDGYYYSSPCSPGNCGQAGPGNSCFDYYTGTNRGFYDESYLYLVEIDTAGVVHSVGAAGNNNGSKGGCYRYDLYEHQRSVALPADTQGGTRIIFQGELYTYTPDLSTVTGTQIQLYAQWYNGVNPVGLMDTIEPNVADTNDFSAVSGIEDGTHVGTDVVYRGTDGNITYAYRSPFSPIWTYEKNIFSGVTVTTPVVTTDYSTGDVYVFGTTSPMKIDGSAVAGCSHSTTQCQVTLTTSSTNELIIVYTTEALDLQPSCTFYVRDSAGLTYSSRSGPADFQNNVVYGNGGRDQLAEFYAKSVNQLSSDTITESISGCQSSFGGEYNGLMAFAISGANFNTPFDPHSALAGAANGQGGLISALISTNYPNDMIISGLQDGGAGCPVPTPGTGFIAITSSGCAATEYQIIGVPVTNYPIGFSDSVNGAWEQIADAVEPASGPSIVMRTRTLADHFADHSILYPVTLRSNAAILETSFAVASLTNSSSLPLIWS